MTLLMVIGSLAVVAGLVLGVGIGGGAQEAAGRAREAYARALDLQKQQDGPGSLALLWEAAGLAPGDAEIQHALGSALERMGALDAAIAAYGRAVSARPGVRPAANSLILALVKAGRGAEAVDRARALVLTSPDDADAHFTLGLAQSEQDVAGAMRSFRRVLDLAPRHTLARYNLALVLQRTDRLPEAVDELTRALAIEPRAEIHYTLGVISWHQGDLERAARALGDAVSADPRHADAHYTLGAVLKAQGKLTGSIDSLRRAIALQPNLWGAQYTLAQAYQLAGDEAAAAAQRTEAERLRRQAALEQEASVWTSVGTRRLDSGDPLGALDHFRRATTVFEAYAPAHYQMGRALRRLGREEASRAAFARAQQLNPSLVAPPDPEGR
jgi:tetratricopeptide (TPR) repeat protein